MTKRALVISPDYPPTNRMSSLRAYYMARALAAAGYAVTVLAEPPATGRAGLPRPDMGLQVVRLAARHRVVWLAKALWWTLWTALGRRRFDVIVSSSGPFLAHAVAAFAKVAWPGAFWAADYRDLWSTGSYYREQPFSGPGLPVRRFIERAILRRAGMVTTVSRGLRDNLSAFHGREVLVYHNGFEPDAGQQTQPPVATTGIRICHTGFLYQARTPRPLMEAITAGGRDAPARLVLAGPTDDATASLIREFAGHPGIEYLGNLPRAESYRLQREADFCLLLEDPEATRKGVITGKVFEYIGMRKPIIAYGVADDSELGEILRGTGLLAFCGSNRESFEAFLAGVTGASGAGRLAPDEAFISKFSRTAISDAFVASIASRMDEGK